MFDVVAMRRSRRKWIILLVFSVIILGSFQLQWNSAILSFTQNGTLVLRGQRHFKKDTEGIIRERVDGIRKKCQDYMKNITRSYKVNYQFIKSLRNKDVFYCPVPKSGWSTWKMLFYREAGVEHLMLDLTRTGFESDWMKAHLTVVNSTFLRNVMALKSYRHRLVFVRNPYDRLVSAYKDKAMRNNGLYVISHRKPCKTVKKLSNGPALTFPEFVRCILKKSVRGNSSLSEYGSGHELDIHWRPQTLLCDFCRVEYNVIGKLETMDDDLRFALKSLHMNATLEKENKSNDTLNRLPLQYWYSQLSEEEIDGLNNLYKYDLDLLGYKKLLK